MTPESIGAAIRIASVSRHHQMGSALIRAVDEVSFEVREGEFLALLGSSGSGKTTVLNLIAGLDRPTAGAIFAHGQERGRMSQQDLARHRSRTIRMVFQAFNLLSRMTLEENVELPLRLAKAPRSERAARLDPVQALRYE